MSEPINKLIHSATECVDGEWFAILRIEPVGDEAGKPIEQLRSGPFLSQALAQSKIDEAFGMAAQQIRARGGSFGFLAGKGEA